MTSRRKDVKQRTSSIDVGSQKRKIDRFILLPASYIPKSHDCTYDSLALTDKVPIKIVSAAILKIDKDKEQDDSSSKILYRPSSKNILRASYCDDKLPNQPVTSIKCTATSKGSLARITQCSIKTKRDGNYCIFLESKLKKGSSHKVIQPMIDLTGKIISDKKAKISSKRTLSERSVSCRKLKPEVTLSPQDSKLACPDRADLKINISLFPEMKDPFSQVTRRDGLDPSERPTFLKKPSKRYKRRICPCNCCQPVQQSAIKDVRSGFLHIKSSALSSPIKICTKQDRLDDQRRLQRLASERTLRTEVTRIESAKSDKASACQRSAAAFRRACLIPEKDTSRLPSGQELLARYKKFIPAYQLERYEICRSKRNGLQDECIPPLLQTILKKEQRHTLDKCIKHEQNVDRLDRSKMSESMNSDQTEVLLYLG